MDKIVELRTTRAEKMTAFTALADKMDADGYVENAADETAYAALVAEVEAIDGKIKRAEEANRLKGAQAIAVSNQNINGGERVHRQPKRHRFGKLKAFKGETAEDDAYEAGQFVAATILGREKSRDWCNENGLGMTLKTAQAEGTNSLGGFLVPIAFEQAVIDLRETYGTFRQLVGVKPLSTDNVNWPKRTGGLTAYWVGENAAITESNKTWGQVSLSAKKLAALSKFSTELEEDAFLSIADDLADEMAYAFAQAEDQAGWIGDGTSTYGGITGMKTKFVAGLASFVGAVDAASGHDTFAEIDATDLVTVMSKLPKYALPNAKWFVSQPGFSMVFSRLMAAAGGNTMELLPDGVRYSYLGFPIVIDQTLPLVLTDLSDVPMLYFGDISKAVIMGERRGFRIKRSDDRYFELDQVGVQATERVDINVHSIGDATAAGPIVALMGE